VLAVTHDHTLSLGERVLRATVQAYGLQWQWQAAPAQPATLIRFITVARSKDEAQSRAAVAATRQHALTQGTYALYAAHTRAWQQRWDASDVLIAGDEQAQQALRFAVYHLISAANPDDESVSVGARALTGDAYHGHVFWDSEIFLLPFYSFTWPEAARAMLGYRYHTLPAACEKAARLGYRGAFYAWESADTGEEATPRGVIGPDGKEIVFRAATEETHISADIAYAVWQYWLASGDDAFLREAGAEIVLETARFWASRATPGDDGRYHIRNVIGPDEYHNGVDDNAYTNVMAQWNLERGIEVGQLLQQRWPEQWATLQQRIALAHEELQQWAEVAERLETGFDPQRGLYEQFAGFFGLEYIDLQTFRPRTPYMDVALGLDRVQRSQVVKQADVVMLLALLWDRFSPAVRATNFDYYAARCSQGSSLSPAMHALVAARLGAVDVAQGYFRDAVAVDLGDTMGNAAQGVHVATLGGLWQAVVFGFAGMRADADGLHFDPQLPPIWQTLKFRVQWRGKRLQISLQSEPLTFTGLLEAGDTLPLTVGDLPQVLREGMAWTCVWDKQAQRWASACRSTGT
jgi:trehalose/maltose hydrolase-like predicted phosphorylase